MIDAWEAALTLPDDMIYIINADGSIVETTELVGDLKASKQCARVFHYDECFGEDARCDNKPVSWSPYGMCEECAKEEQFRCYLYDK